MSKFSIHLIITVLTALFLFIGLNMVPLFDWDELNFAECAREMVVSKNWLYTQIGYEPFWEKPPLFIWLQSLGIQLGGLQPWVFKLPNVIAGVISANLAYHIGCISGKRMLGVFWSVTLIFTLITFIYWKSAVIDPVFNLFIVLAIFKWYQISQASLNDERSHIYYLLSGIFLGLAILTKGPVAILIMGLVVAAFSTFRSRWFDVFNGKIFLFIVGLLTVLACWIIPLINHNGFNFFSHFMAYQIELFKGQIPQHNQPWFYHIVVLLLLCFPSSLLALPHLFGNRIMDRNVDNWHLVMRSLFWVVLIVFSITTTKIIHYSSLCWWPLSYFGAYQVYTIYTNRDKFVYWVNIPLLLVGLLLMTALWIVPLIAIIRPVPQNLLSVLDPFSKEILLSMPKWDWPTLIPATLFTFWFIPWIVLSFFGKNPNPLYLYILSGAVALTTYLTIIPETQRALQAPVINVVKVFRKNHQFLETWGYKTYALYYYSEFNPKDFEGMNPENPLPEGILYPKQESRRLHAHNPQNHAPFCVITKNTFQPDDSYLQKFNVRKKFNGYILWQRKPQ